MSNNRTKTILVIGVSSSGKSTFISEFLIPVLTNNKSDLKLSDIEVVFAWKLKSNYSLGKKKCVIVHYNSLLAYDDDPSLVKSDISKEPVLKKLLNTETFDEVFYCYTPDSILLERIEKRSLVEPILSGDLKSSYPNQRILNSINENSQREILIETQKILKGLGNKFSIVFSQEKHSMIMSIECFVKAPRSLFLEKVLRDDGWANYLLQRHLHKFSKLAAECAKAVSLK